MAQATGTVAEALASATAALAEAGVDSPRLDAELLLEDATGTPASRIRTEPEAPVAAAAAMRFGAHVRRRLRREPVAYILGRRGFRRIELEVDRRVLIPRPETELLVEVAVELAPRRVLDVGTGSGAVALAVADELAGCHVTGTDTSLDALAVAGVNRDRLGLGERVDLVLGSLPPAGGAPFDLVVANLPYVSEPQWGELAPEIARFEPLAALIAGPTGLEAVEGLLGAVATGELETAAIALEVGEGQAGAVSELARRAGFEQVGVRQDLAAIERVVIGR